MTPTEQDKELADAIFQLLDGLSAVVSINHTTNRKGYAERRKRDGFIVYKTRDELLQLIAADRKRVELEARLNEVQNAYEHWTNGRKFISSYFQGTHSPINQYKGGNMTQHEREVIKLLETLKQADEEKRAKRGVRQLD